jgi:hypothetical protein
VSAVIHEFARATEMSARTAKTASPAIATAAGANVAVLRDANPARRTATDRMYLRAERTESISVKSLLLVDMSGVYARPAQISRTRSWAGVVRPAD